MGLRGTRSRGRARFRRRPKCADSGCVHLVVYGTAHITEGGAPELLQELAHVYIGPDVPFPPMEFPPPGFVLRITPHRLSGVGPWADGPA